MSRPFPDHPFLSGGWEPWPEEGECRDLVVEGEVPRDLGGTLYRNGPNPQFSPRGRYHPFSGDGMVHAFEIGDGRVHYRNRWVRTPRFELERGAGESLFGPFGDFANSDPRAVGVPDGPANTNVVWHGGRLLALVEGGLVPTELDPETLETRGLVDFDGQLVMKIDPQLAEAMGADLTDGTLPRTFTAHPKIDPETGEMLAFGYGGLAPYVGYYVIDANGKLERIEDLDTPFPAMVHDFVTTRNFVIFPLFPATLRIEKMAEGGELLNWEPDLGTRIGVFPRTGGNDDLRWFETDPSFAFHPMNAHEEEGRLVVELAQYERLPIPAGGNSSSVLADVPAQLVRWVIDLEGGGVKEERLDDLPIEFPRLDERFAGLPYQVGFAAGGNDIVEGFTSILRYEVATGRRRSHELGAGRGASEPIFVPRRADAREGEGYVLSVVYDRATDRSELLILDAENIEGAPLATARLPHRVPYGFHGNWRQR
jgi:carotenoid cleavage dioxygenase-like enzyme